MPNDDELLTNEPDDTEGGSEDNNDEPVVLRDGGGDSNDNNNDEEDNDMANDPIGGKLKRSAYLHYLATDFDFTAATPTAATAAAWFLIGADVEDMSVELNPDTEIKKNILDETSVIDKGYEPSVDVDTYYATPTDALYPKLKDIMMNRKTDAACRTYFMTITIDTDGSSHDAWVEEVIVKPTSYGGPQGGVAIPYTISFAGNRQQGTATISNKVPTFSVTT